MRKLLLFIAPFLFSNVAHAAHVACSGQTMGYSYYLSGNIHGRHAGGTIHATVSGGVFADQRSVAMRVIASDVRPGSYLRATAQGPGVTGSLVASYDRGSRAYIGTITVQVAGNGGTGSIACRMSGERRGAYFEELTDIESAIDE